MRVLHVRPYKFMGALEKSMVQHPINLLYLAAAVTVLSLACAGSALGEGRDELGIAEAKISLIEAVTAAEQHLGGKAASAEIKREDGLVHYNQYGSHRPTKAEVVALGGSPARPLQDPEALVQGIEI